MIQATGMPVRRRRGITVTSSGVAAFSPSSIAGLIGWWKADSLALSDGTAVATWPDSSTGAHDATQATGANQPIFKTAIQNGKPVLRFNGTSQFMDTAMAAALGGPFSVFAMVIPSSVTGFRTILGGQVANARTIDQSGGKYELDKEGVNTQVIATAAETISVAGTMSLTYDGSGNGAIWSNGVANGTATSLQTYPAGSSRIGATAAPGAFWSGDIGELLVYDSVLSTGNRQSVEGYLRGRWNTP